MGTKKKVASDAPSWPEIRDQVDKLTFKLGRELIVNPFEFAEDICEASGKCDFLQVACWMARMVTPDRHHQILIWEWVVKKRREILDRQMVQIRRDQFQP